MILRILLLISASLLVGCSGSNVSQFALQTPFVEPAKPSGITVEVLEVSLPLYAQSQEIPVMDASGTIRTDPDVLWADEPSRALSLTVAEALSRITGGVVAVEPWPLDDRAAYRLDVRVQTLLASADGTLRFAGQYFVARDDGGRPRADWFDISVPLADTTVRAIADATGAAALALATQVAGKL